MTIRCASVASIPTTLIWGALDTIAPTTVPDYIWANYLKGRTVADSYWQIGCANHFLQHDRPEDSAAIVQATINHAAPQFSGSGSCTPVLVAHNP